MVQFDRWFSFVVAAVIIAWLFRDEIVRVNVAEMPVGVGETQKKPDNIVGFGAAANAA